MKISFERLPESPPPSSAYSYEAVVTDLRLDNVPVTITLTIDEARQDQGMQMAFSALKIEAHPGVTVSTSMLRDLPLQKLRQEVAEKRLEALDSSPGQELDEVLLMFDNAHHLAKNGPSEENLDFVGRLYLAYQLTGAPVKAIMEFFGISRSTATRWVRLAEETGKFGYLRSGGRNDGVDQEA